MQIGGGRTPKLAAHWQMTERRGADAGAVSQARRAVRPRRRRAPTMRRYDCANRGRSMRTALYMTELN